MLAQQYEQDIVTQVRNKGIDYFISTGERLGLCITRGTAIINNTPIPMIGRKCTASGSLPRQESMTPVLSRNTPMESTVTLPTTPRGRDTTPCAHVRMQTDTSPSLQGMVPTPTLETRGNMDLNTIMAAINAALGPTI